MPVPRRCTSLNRAQAHDDIIVWGTPRGSCIQPGCTPWCLPNGCVSVPLFSFISSISIFLFLIVLSGVMLLSHFFSHAGGQVVQRCPHIRTATTRMVRSPADESEAPSRHPSTPAPNVPKRQHEEAIGWTRVGQLTSICGGRSREGGGHTHGNVSTGPQALVTRPHWGLGQRDRPDRQNLIDPDTWSPTHNREDPATSVRIDQVARGDRPTNAIAARLFRRRDDRRSCERPA